MPQVILGLVYLFRTYENSDSIPLVTVSIVLSMFSLNSKFMFDDKLYLSENCHDFYFTKLKQKKQQSLVVFGF